MKKILIILFCLPLFVLGQDLPTNNSTTELKITNEKTRAKLKKKIEKDHKKSLKMKPYNRALECQFLNFLIKRVVMR